MFTLLERHTSSSQSSESAVSDFGPNDLLLPPFGIRRGGGRSLPRFVFYPIGITMWPYSEGVHLLWVLAFFW